MARRVAQYTLVMAIILSLLGGSLHATDLKTVLDKHLGALGNKDSLEALTSVAIYASITYMNLEGRMVSLIKFPSNYYERIILPVGTQEDGFDGSTAWSRDFNGLVRRQSADEEKPIIDNLYFQSYSYVLPGRMRGNT